MDVVDGCTHNLQQRCAFKIPCTKSFHLIPHKAYVGMITTHYGATSKWAWPLDDSTSMPYEYVFMIADFESFRLVPHMTNITEF